jgi:hypothetical protein
MLVEPHAGKRALRSRIGLRYGKPKIKPPEVAPVKVPLTGLARRPEVGSGPARERQHDGRRTAKACHETGVTGAPLLEE